jgi:hypothetical protein
MVPGTVENQVWQLYTLKDTFFQKHLSKENKKTKALGKKK